MKYIVEYYKPKMFGKTFDEIGQPDPMTRYTIDADTSFDAAILAHAFESGYTGEEMAPIPFDSTTYPARTIKERLIDDIKYNGKRMDGGEVFAYGHFAGKLIIVYKE